jgi:hypothetical protein
MILNIHIGDHVITFNQWSLYKDVHDNYADLHIEQDEWDWAIMWYSERAFPLDPLKSDTDSPDTPSTT